MASRLSGTHEHRSYNRYPPPQVYLCLYPLIQSITTGVPLSLPSHTVHRHRCTSVSTLSYSPPPQVYLCLHPLIQSTTTGVPLSPPSHTVHHHRCTSVSTLSYSPPPQVYLCLHPLIQSTTTGVPLSLPSHTVKATVLTLSSLTKPDSHTRA